MTHRTQHSRRWLGLALLAFWLIGCAVVLPGPRSPTAPPSGAPSARPGPAYLPQAQVVREVGGPRLPHAKHAELGLECTDCHMPDADDDAPFQPQQVSRDTCAECHDEMDEELEEGAKILPRFFAPEGTPRWAKAVLSYEPNILFSHAPHGRECADCHDMSSDVRRAETKFTMDQCMACHQKRGAPNACATCHRDYRQEVAPATHDAGWILSHGPTMRAFEGAGADARCSICHDVQTFCNDCHQNRLPPSHQNRWLEQHANLLVQGGATEEARCAFCHTDTRFCQDCHQGQMPPSHSMQWEQRHGDVYRNGGIQGERRCAFCHKESAFCQDCHRNEPPKSHTNLFRTRTHGLMAAIDRRQCQTCHTTDFCVRCHTSTAPRSHRGSWAGTRSTHCVQCHFPIQRTTSCSACHFGNPAHATAPRVPAFHPPGPLNCRICHNAVGGGGAMPLRHPDPGLDCLFCHQR